jgi:hypothetical protein
MYLGIGWHSAKRKISNMVKPNCAGAMEFIVLNCSSRESEQRRIFSENLADTNDRSVSL